MAKAFLQKRWSVLLGLLLGLTSTAFLFAQVFDTKDIAVTFDREAYNEYKAREFNSINDLICRYEADLLWWMPLALPDTDRGWWKQDSFFSLSTFNPAGFPSDFVKNLVPVTREDVAVYPVSITENYFTRYREICNANGALIASVPPPARYNPRWFVYQNYPSLDAWALSESRKNEIIGIYDQARLTVKMDLILDDELVNLIMRRSVLAAVAAQNQPDAKNKGHGGNTLAMKRSLTATSNIVVDCVSLTNGLTLQISYPNDFTNHLEIYAGSDLLADTWTLADTGLLTAGTNAIFWTDTNAIAGVKYFNVGDAQTDADNDGLVDAREKRLYHSNPNSMDSDNDGLVDGYSGVVPTNAYPSGVTTNGGPYVEGELTWGTSPALFDTDDDGMSDGWEVAHGHNPLDVNDPPNVRGIINYSGGQTGPIIVLAVETADSWATNHSVRLNGPGAYRIPNLTPTNYWLKAFVDNNGDASNGPAEAWGVYSTSAIEITNKVVGIDITLTDPDANTNNIPDFWEISNFGSLTNSGAGDDPDSDQYSNLEEYQAGTDPNDISNHPWNVSGTVFYTGPQTGTIWVIASPSLESWSGVRSTSIAAPGAYTITHLPPNTNYWIRAWRDTDGDNAAAYFEANGDAAQNPIYLDSNCTNADLTLADSDSDGDGLPDWWEVRYGLNAFDGVRSDAAGWWKLDASSGTNVLDSSAYGNHGTLWNGLTNAWTEGVVSNGLRLNGTNSYVQLADSTSLKPQFVSAALWMRPDRDYTNGSAAFFSKRVSGGTAGYTLGYENGKLAFTIYASGAKTVQLPCALSNGVWRHVAGTYGGQYQRLYVDGVLAVETNYFWDPGYGNIAQDAINPRIGASADTSPSDHFAGTLDDVLVFGQELSSNRVVGLYQAGADFDHDGRSNWREYSLNTDPNVNNPPVASNDTFTANENTPLLIPAPGVLANDSDLGSFNLVAQLVSGITGLTFNANGSFTYVPLANWYGVTSFTYRACNGFTNSTASTVTIFVYSNSVFAWGANSSGECNVPASATNVIAVSAGYYRTLALRSDGSVIGWGFDGNVPASATNIISISAGGWFNLALRTNGTVVAWGDNTYSQTNVPVTATNVTAISAGGWHGLALRTNGTVVAWGDNTYSQTNVPGTATNVIAISAGASHNLVLRKDGSVVAWGNNIDGQTNVPSTATNVIAVSAGSYHSMALRSNGTVVAWGYNGYGERTIPASATNVIAISAGEYYSMVLRYDGTVIAWGKHDCGQTNVPAGLQATVIDAGYYHSLAIGKIIQRPVASNDTYTVDENTTLNVFTPGVLTNDFDPSSFPLTAQQVSGIAGLTLDADGSFTYTPPANWHGVTNFTYLASNSMTNSTVATVTIVVNPVTSFNYAPTCDADTNQIALIGTNGLATITLSGTGSDIDGVIVSWAWVTNGTQIATGQTAIVELPIGSNSVALVVTDNGGLTATDTVTILALDPNGDTDNDGLPDGWEMLRLGLGYNPLASNRLDYGRVVITSPIGALDWDNNLMYCFSVTNKAALAEVDNGLCQRISGIVNSDAITNVLIIIGTTDPYGLILRRYNAPVVNRQFAYDVPLIPGDCNYITVYGEYNNNGVKWYTDKDSLLLKLICQQIPDYNLSMEFESNVACTNTVQPIFDALVQSRTYSPFAGNGWTMFSQWPYYPTACWCYPWYNTWDGTMKTIAVPSNLSTYRFDVRDDCQDSNTHDMTMRIIVNGQTVHTETRTDISNKITNDYQAYDTALKGGVFTGPRLDHADGFSVNTNGNLVLLPPLKLIGYHYQTPIHGFANGAFFRGSNGLYGMTTTYPAPFYGMTNMMLTGPNGTDPVNLEYGQSAQFTATGTLMVNAPGMGIVSNFANVNIVDCFIGGKTNYPYNYVGPALDDFGVFNAAYPGDFVVSCADCATTISVHTASAPIVTSIDLDMDTDRSGAIDNLNSGDDVGEDDWTLQRGSLIFPADCELDKTNDVRGLSQLIVRGTTAVGIDQVLRLSIIKGYALELYLLNSTGTVLTASGEYNIPGCYTNDMIFYLAARLPRYGATGTNMDYLVQLQLVNAGNQILKSDTVRFKVAPMILPWDGDPVEQVYATRHITNCPSATNIPNLVIVNSDDAKWAQDFVKPAKVQCGSSVAADVLANLGHTRAGNFVEKLKQTETNVVMRATSWDVYGEGGTIMISPPLPGAPYGKAIVGNKNNRLYYLEPYFTGQAIQTNMIVLPTDWLLVGHTDEVISFVDSNRVLVADPWTAANIIHAAITNGNGTNIIWYGETPLSDSDTKQSFLEVAVAKIGGGTFKTNALSSPGMDTTTTAFCVPASIFDVGDYLRVDNEVLKVTAINATTVTVLRAQAGTTNETHTTAAQIYALSGIMRWNLPIDDPNVHTNIVNLTNALSTALGSYSVTYVKLPVLFDRVEDADGKIRFVAGSANVVNCLVYPGQGLYMQDTGSTDFNGFINSNVTGAVFINLWDDYHRYDGEVHCGTATRRTIDLTPPWWERIEGWQ